MTTDKASKLSAVSILSRALENKGEGGSVEGARYILNLSIRAEDQAKMINLMSKNQEDKLTPDEKKQLSAFIEAEGVIAILKARAMATLKRAGEEP